MQKNSLVFVSLVSLAVISLAGITNAQSPSPIALPTVVVSSPAVAGETSATLTGNITSLGGAPVTTRGFNYGLTTSYTNTNSNTAASLPTGVYSRNLSNLICNTTYHYRAFATNAGGTATTSDNTFTTSACTSTTPTPSVVAIPTVAIPSATSIGETTATLNGNITSIGGASVTARGFNYGLTSSYSSTVSTNGSYGTGAYSIDITGLTCGTVYHFRSFASNSGGTASSTDQTFTSTACPSPSPTPTPSQTTPTVANSTVASVTETSATFSSNITSTGGVGLTVSRRGFQYGVGAFTDIVCEDGTFSTGAYSRGSNTTCGATTAVVLQCGTTYQYRAFATNTYGPSYGATNTFTTTGCPSPSPTATPTSPTPEPTSTVTPTPSTSPMAPSLAVPTVTSISTTTAILNGEITSIGSDDVTERGFKYGTTDSLNQTLSQSSGPYSTGTFSGNLSNLSCGTKYYFLSFATNAVSSTFTSVDTFTTLGCPTPTPTPTPPVVSNVASSSNVTKTTVTLSGAITSGTATERGFDYGSDTNYGTKVKQNGSYASGGFTLNATGLTPGHLYHFRAYASNDGGTDYSDDYTFTTNPSPNNLVGWAWSSNIGWIKLDPIEINQTNGDLTGYAWSPNIGWVKFGGLAGFPGSGGNANINPDTGEVTGWARACAGTVGGETDTYGADCRSMTSRTDGWDGWIELSGTNHVSLASAVKGSLFEKWFANAQSTTRYEGLKMDQETGIVSGMAWGGNVVGWLSVNAGISNNTLPFGATCAGIDQKNGKVRFTATPSGGSGNYQYAWEGGAFGTKFSYDKVYSGIGTLSATLQVKDVDQNITVNPACSYTPNPGTGIVIEGGSNPPCTITPATVLVGEPATFSLTGITKPPSTYRYYWLTGDTVTQNPSTLVGSYNQGQFTVPIKGYDAQVYVQDISNGPTKGTVATFSCGKFNVSPRELKLNIGVNANDIAKNQGTSLTIKSGQSFRLEWVNTLALKTEQNPDGYTCSKIIDNESDTWTSSWRNSSLTSDSINATTDKSIVGTYNMTIQCSSQALGNKTASVQLKVVSTSIKEI